MLKMNCSIPLHSVQWFGYIFGVTCIMIIMISFLLISTVMTTTLAFTTIITTEPDPTTIMTTEVTTEISTEVSTYLSTHLSTAVSTVDTTTEDLSTSISSTTAPGIETTSLVYTSVGSTSDAETSKPDTTVETSAAPTTEIYTTQGQTTGRTTSPESIAEQSTEISSYVPEEITSSQSTVQSGDLTTLNVTIPLSTQPIEISTEATGNTWKTMIVSGSVNPKTYKYPLLYPLWWALPLSIPYGEECAYLDDRDAQNVTFILINLSPKKIRLIPNYSTCCSSFPV